MANATELALAATLKLRRFWSWWSGELIELLPLSLRPALKFLVGSTFIEFAGKRVSAYCYRDSQLQSLGDLDFGALPAAEQALSLQAWLNHAVPDRNRLVVVLPRGQVLSRRIELPPAAEQNLRQAIGFELNRYTPFKAGEVYFDYRLPKRAPGQRELAVHFAVVPIASIAPSLALLAQAGVKPTAVVPVDDLSFEHLPMNLLPPEQRAKAAPRVGTVNALLAVVALVLFAAALALPLWQKRQTIVALSPLVETAKRDAEGANRLKKELDTLVQTYDFLLQRKHVTPAATTLLEELTRILPEGTWLQQMSLKSHAKGWEIQIQGETTISSKLAGVIEDSPMFRDASFKSPLVKGQAPMSERFHLGAEVELPSPPKPVTLTDKPPAATAGAMDTTVSQTATTPASLPAQKEAPAPATPSKP